MELDMRKAQPQDLDGLDQVMLVISDAAGERGKVLQLLEHITADPQKYLLVAEDMDTGTICGSLFGVVFEDICDSCGPFCWWRTLRPGELPGQGRGQEMFQEIERWGKEQDEMDVSQIEAVAEYRFELLCRLTQAIGETGEEFRFADFETDEECSCRAWRTRWRGNERKNPNEKQKKRVK